MEQINEQVKTKPKQLRVKTITRAAPRNGIPGNLLINGEWFSSREWRNNLLSADLPAEIVLPTFIGALLRYEELEITQELLDKNGGIYTHRINGRDIQYRRVGKNNIGLVIDFSTVNVTESLLNTNKLKAVFAGMQPTPRPAPVQQQPQSEEISTEEIEEPNSELNNEAEVTPGQINQQLEEEKEIIEPEEAK